LSAESFLASAVEATIGVHRWRQFRASGNYFPLPRILFVWVLVILVLQALNLDLGVSWPYLVGVYGILVNAFTFFLILLLGWSGAEDAAL